MNSAPRSRIRAPNFGVCQTNTTNIQNMQRRHNTALFSQTEQCCIEIELNQYMSYVTLSHDQVCIFVHTL